MFGAACDCSLVTTLLTFMLSSNLGTCPDCPRRQGRPEVRERGGGPGWQRQRRPGTHMISRSRRPSWSSPGPRATRPVRTAPGADPVREAVPREGLAAVVAAGKRPGSRRSILEEQGRTRVRELVPLRHTRMLASPFAFLRKSAAVMASDLARTPSTGIEVQLCGDAHLANFGLFATPERNLVVRRLRAQGRGRRLGRH